MKAVFRRELSSYFTGLSGCVFGAFLLLFAGIYTMAYNIRAAVSNFEYVLSSMSFIFLVIVPILTMRVFAEEKRQKTDQLLYSLPLTMTEVVMGKYLAMLVMFLIPLCIIGIYPAVLSHFGKVNLAAAYGALVGFFFLGAALLAVGAFISSVTDSQGVAAVLCGAARELLPCELIQLLFVHSLRVLRGADLCRGGAGADILSDDQERFCLGGHLHRVRGARLCVLHIQERQLRGTVPEYTLKPVALRAL